MENKNIKIIALLCIFLSGLVSASYNSSLLNPENSVNASSFGNMTADIIVQTMDSNKNELGSVIGNLIIILIISSIAAIVIITFKGVF